VGCLADGLGDGLGDGDGLGLGEGLRGAAAWGVDGLRVAVFGSAVLGSVVLGERVFGVPPLGVVAPGDVGLGVVVMGPLPGAVALGLPLAETVGVPGLVPGGVKLGGVVGGAPPHADTDAVASIAMMAQPRTVRRKRRRAKK
jgi:hypothetical protein